MSRLILPRRSLLLATPALILPHRSRAQIATVALSNVQTLVGAPTITGVAVAANGTTLTVTFSAAVAINTAADFTFFDGSTQYTLSGWSTGSSTTQTCTIGTTVNGSDTCTFNVTNVAFTSPALAGTVTSSAVTNGSAQGLPAHYLQLNSAGYGFATGTVASTDYSDFTVAYIMDIQVQCYTASYNALGTGAPLMMVGNGYPNTITNALCLTSSGYLQVRWIDGGGEHVVTSTVPVTTNIAANTLVWLRGTVNISTSQAGYADLSVQFYTSLDGSTWTALGSNVAVSSAAYYLISSSSFGVFVGSSSTAWTLPALPASIKIMKALWYTVGASLKLGIDFTAMTTGQASFSSATGTAGVGQAWSINSPGAII